MRTYSRKREGGIYIQNYEDKCRLCLCKGSSMTPIFPEGSEEITSVLANRIMLCVGLVTIQDENLPSKICSECNELLEKCYAFRKLCQSSYQKLKSHLLAVRCIKHLEKCTTEDNCDQSVVILEKTDPSELKTTLINSPFTSKPLMGSQSLLKPFTTDNQVLLLDRTHYLTHDMKTEPTSILKQCLQNISPKSIPYTANNTQNSSPENHSKLSIESLSKVAQTSSFIDSEMENMSSNTIEIPVLHKIKKSQLNLYNNSSYNANNGTEQMDVNEDQSKLVLIMNPSAENNVNLKQFDVAREGVEMQILEPLVSQQTEVKDFKEDLIVDDTDMNQMLVPDVQERQEEDISKDLNMAGTTPVEEESREDEVTSFIRASLEAVDIMSIHNNVVKLKDIGVTVELVTEDGTLVTLVLEEDGCDMKQDNQTVVTPSQINLELPNKNSKVKKVPKSLNTGCDICGKSYSSRSAALRHRRVHSGERPYQCHVCQRHFAQREVCERHQLVHREKRPFTCTECPKSFTQRLALVNHIRSHQDPSIRPLTLHRCNKCPKMFLHASGLTRHSVVHTDKYYVCELCDRKFKDRSSLLRHMKRTKHKNDNSTFVAT